MSKLIQFRELERHLTEQMAVLEAMKSDKGLEREIEFEGKLRMLLGEHSKSLRDVIALLDPQAGSKFGRTVATPRGSRKPRAIKVYKNPYTDEVIETKGGNHKGLKAWKAEHGSHEVETWVS